jgi:hypothetical protein
MVAAIEVPCCGCSMTPAAVILEQPPLVQRPAQRMELPGDAPGDDEPDAAKSST